MKLLDRIATVLHIVCIGILLILTILGLIDKLIYKPVIENNNIPVNQDQCSQDVEIEASQYYIVTSDERYLLAKLAHSEGSICSEECQRDIVSVVFNRLESGKWRKDMNGDNKITLYDIIYYPNAFTPATNGAIDKWEPTSKDYAAVDYVIKNGPTVPTEVRYFRTDHDFSWDGYENYKVIDNVYFGYLVDWQKGAW